MENNSKGISINTGEWVYGWLKIVDGTSYIVNSKNHEVRVFQDSICKNTGIEYDSNINYYQFDKIKTEAGEGVIQYGWYNEKSLGFYICFTKDEEQTLTKNVGYWLRDQKSEIIGNIKER